MCLARCPSGMFFNSTSQNCLRCPIGTYQDEQGQIFCESCPNDQSTEKEGTRESDGCLGKWFKHPLETYSEPSQISKIKSFSKIVNSFYLLNIFVKSSIYLHAIRQVKSKVTKIMLIRISYPIGIYLLKVNNRNTRATCEICSKLAIKTPERRHPTLLLTLNIFHTLF